MTRQRLRRIGGNLFIAAIILFGSVFVVAGLTGADPGVHGDWGPYGCLVTLLCVVLVAISVVCWVGSLFLR